MPSSAHIVGIYTRGSFAMKGFYRHQGVKQELDISGLELLPSEERQAFRRQGSQKSIRALQRTCTTGEVEENATFVMNDGSGTDWKKQPMLHISGTDMGAFDYHSVKRVMEEIQGYFTYPQFVHTYGDNAENIVTLVKHIMDAADRREEAFLLQKSLAVLKEITVNGADTLVGSGILALLGTLPTM